MMHVPITEMGNIAAEPVPSPRDGRMGVLFVVMIPGAHVGLWVAAENLGNIDEAVAKACLAARSGLIIPGNTQIPPIPPQHG